MNVPRASLEDGTSEASILGGGPGGFWVSPGPLLCSSCCVWGGPLLASVGCPYSSKGWRGGPGTPLLEQQPRFLPLPWIPFLAAPGLLGLAAPQIPSSPDLPAVNLSREHAPDPGVACRDRAPAAQGAFPWGSVLVPSCGGGRDPLPSFTLPNPVRLCPAPEQRGWVGAPGAGKSQFTMRVDLLYPGGGGSLTGRQHPHGPADSRGGGATWPSLGFGG